MSGSAARCTTAEGPERTQNYSGLHRRLADQAERLVLDLTSTATRRSTRRTSTAALPDGIAVEGARAAPAARQHVHLRPVRLRDHQGPDAARRTSTATDSQSQNLGHRRLRPARARATRPRSSNYTFCGSRRPGRSAAGSSSTRALRSAGRDPSLDVGVRGADDPGHRRVHDAAASSARRTPVDAPSTCSRISTTSAASTRCAPASTRRRLRTARTTPRTTSAPTRSRASDAFQPGTPRSYTRRIGDPNIDYKNLQAGALPAGRHPRPQEPDAQPGRALRGRRRTCATSTTSARASASRGRRSRAARRRCAASAGIFYDWLSTEHLRADAARRRLPPAGAEHHQPVVSRIPATSAASRRRPTAICSATICRCSATPGSAPASIATVTDAMLSVNATYAHTSGDDLLRGLNLNAPVERRAARSAVRQHRAGDRRRRVAAAHPQLELARPDLAAGAESVAMPLLNWRRVGSASATLRTNPEQHRRRVQSAGDGRLDRTGVLNRATSIKIG